jgi:hypothetical protein
MQIIGMTSSPHYDGVAVALLREASRAASQASPESDEICPARGKI